LVRGENLHLVTGEVADDRVKLGQRYLHLRKLLPLQRARDWAKRIRRPRPLLIRSGTTVFAAGVELCVAVQG
jgi:hypothetical protein